jgi:hypothetical protein
MAHQVLARRTLMVLVYVYMVLASLCFSAASDNGFVFLGCVFTFMFFRPLISKLMVVEDE